MKTPNLLTLTGVALAALTLQVSAYDVLLSPRAKDNQPKVVRASTVDPNLAAASRKISAPPRIQEQRATQAAGAKETRNLAVGACALGSPKQVERLGKTPSVSCCGANTAACNTPKACCPTN